MQIPVVYPGNSQDLKVPDWICINVIHRSSKFYLKKAPEKKRCQGFL